MGTGADYFDTLVTDYTVEVADAVQTEGARRLLYMLKKSLNGDSMMLYDNTDTEATEVVAVSPEFTTMFGYNVAEIDALGAAGFFHANDFFIAEIHGDNNLCGYYSSRCKKSNDAYIQCYINGTSVTLDAITWRILIFEQIV